MRRTPWRRVVLVLYFVTLFGGRALGAEPVRLLSETPERLVVEMKVAGVKLTPRNIQGRRYLKLRAQGFLFQSPEGTPEIPHLTSLVKVPTGYEPTIEKIERISRRTVKLKSDLAFEPSPLIHDDSGRRILRKDRAYETRYGAAPVEISEVSFAESEKFAVLRWSPFDYDAASRRLRWAKMVRVTLSFQPNARFEKAPVTSVAGRSVGRYLAVNPEVSKEFALEKARGQYIDLIIAHESHQETLMRYLWFKRIRGHEVREYYVNNQTADQIKAIIKKEYASPNPPSSTLLVGNISQIPSWPGSGDCKYTDFPYQTLDSGSLPDVSVGRIPAHHRDELDAFIAKSLARETEPRKDGDVLLTSGRDTSLGCPANVTAVGEEFATAGGRVNLIKRLRTQVSTAEVINGYNDDPNIIVYDGHGNQSGMLEIPLTSSGLDVLKNRTFPIVLDIACLNASWSGGANSRNFAEKILLQPGAGVVGIMASGGSGYGHDFFRTIGSLLGSAQKNLNADATLNAIGRIIMLAKAKHGTQDKTYWNYYGDPATQVWQGSR